jgi:MoaA/NifB/PqqE/SkfB family radical SAM enzyme
MRRTDGCGMTELGGRVRLLRSWLTRLVEPPPVQQDPGIQWTQIRADLGVSKVRLTGGEPLLRRDLEVLVSLVASTPGISDVALTTNGSLLAAHAQSLRDAGLHRVTVSLDSLDPTVFAAMGDTKLPLSKVLDGIAAAVLDWIAAMHPAEPVAAARPGEVAQR